MQRRPSEYRRSRHAVVRAAQAFSCGLLLAICSQASSSNIFRDPDPDKAKDLVVDYLKTGGEAAASNEDMTREIAEAGLDLVIGLADLGFPGLSLALGPLKGLFGSSEEQVPAIIEKRLAALETGLKLMSDNVSEIANAQKNISNQLRTGFLEERRGEIRNYALDLLLIESMSKKERQVLLAKIKDLADWFLPLSERGRETWEWSVIRVTGNRETLTVRVRIDDENTAELSLEPYLQSLALALTASRKTGLPLDEKFLDQHIYFLTGETRGNRPEKKEDPRDDPPFLRPFGTQPTLMDIASKVTCANNGARYPDETGTCSMTVQCGDGALSRSSVIKRNMSGLGRNVLCTYDVRSVEAVQEQLIAEVRASPGTIPPLLVAVAEHLDGTIRGEVTGQFDTSTTLDFADLYAVDANGQLRRFSHVTTTRDNFAEKPNQQIDCAKPGAAALPECVGQISQVDCRTAPGKYSERCQPALNLPDSVAAKTAASGPFAKYQIEHELGSPAVVDADWGVFASIIPSQLRADGFVVYGLRSDGGLIWRRISTETGVGTLSSVQASKPVGRGWNTFSGVFSTGEGVVYGVNPNGELVWYRHKNNLARDEEPQWESRVVGQGWNGFKTIFSPGLGVIYAIKPNGDLVWYRHKAYLTGAGLERVDSWEGPKPVGTKWDGFTHVTAGPAGFIYAINATGQLVFYRHLGWESGTTDWEAPVVLAEGWGGYRQVFTTVTQPGAAIIVK